MQEVHCTAAAPCIKWLKSSSCSLSDVSGSPLGAGGALRVLGRLRGQELGGGRGGATPLGDGPHLRRTNHRC